MSRRPVGQRSAGEDGWWGAGVLAAWPAIAFLLALLLIHEGSSWTGPRAFLECLAWPFWVCRAVLDKAFPRRRDRP